MTAGTERSSRASTCNRQVARLEDTPAPAAGGRDFRESSRERNHMVVSCAGVVCKRMTTALPARRPSAGWGHPRHDVVGPRAGGGLLGGKDPSGRLVQTLN